MLYKVGYYLGKVSVDRESHCFKQWKELMQRCYSETYKKRNPKAVNKVCEAWNCYDNFYKWYHKNNFKEGTLTCKTRDPECNFYCEDTSYILPLSWVRCLAYRHGKGFAPRSGKFYVRAKDPANKDKKVHLGVYNTEEEAYQAFINWKIEKVIQLKGLYSHCDNITNKLEEYIGNLNQIVKES